MGASILRHFAVKPGLRSLAVASVDEEDRNEFVNVIEVMYEHYFDTANTYKCQLNNIITDRGAGRSPGSPECSLLASWIACITGCFPARVLSPQSH
eukprot:1145748-Pelagomonas_calceolata.AAC.3